jgi:CubicO group peptidase (beta-lactamase class C family)
VSAGGGPSGPPSADAALGLPEVAPDAAGFRPGALTRVDDLLERARAARDFPGGVLAIAHEGRLARLRPFGRLTYDDDAPAVEVDTLYDLSSLTKVVATTTVAMALVDEGRLDLARPVPELVPEFRGEGKEDVRIEHLLSHSAGLPATAPLYRDRRGREACVEAVATMPLVYPPATRSLYSDLGFILLGEVLERTSGQPLDAMARERVQDPLGMADTLFRPGPELLPRIAPTERDPWRGRLLRGEVHDPNAFAMGGVAAHAGLFGTAPDLSRFAQMMLDGGSRAGRRVVSAAQVARFTRRADVPGSSRALGWDTPTGRSSAGRLLSPRAFGHVGFTGTSLWIDPDRRLFFLLLTNRVHPTAHRKIDDVRRRLADGVVEALAAG